MKLYEFIDNFDYFCNKYANKIDTGKTKICYQHALIVSKFQNIGLKVSEVKTITYDEKENVLIIH